MQRGRGVHSPPPRAVRVCLPGPCPLEQQLLASLRAFPQGCANTPKCHPYSGCSVVRGTEACVMCHQYPGCETGKSTSPRGCSQPEQDNPIPALLRRPAPHVSSRHSCCVRDFTSPAASSGVKNLRGSFSELREGGGKKDKAEVGHGAELYGLVIV